MRRGGGGVEGEGGEERRGWEVKGLKLLYRLPHLLE